MFKSQIVVPEYKNLLGWRQHHDINEINLPTTLTDSETGEYFQQKHPALRLDIIQASIPSNYDLEQYLEEVVAESTNEIFNDLLQYRQINDYGKTLLEQSTLLNKYGWKNNTIPNQTRFVGFQIRVKAITGLQMLINQIGIQFDGADTFDLYLFHSSKKAPLKIINVVASGDATWDWSQQDLELSGFNSTEYHGGVFVLGYYQEDLSTQAINYTNFNWDKGECGSCNNSHYSIWKSIRQHYHIYPIYVANGNYVKEEMFDLDNAMFVNDQSWGLNMKLSVRCDLTDFFVQNKFVFKNLLAYKVVHKILMMMKYSQQINYIEENLKMMIIRDLEGDVDTKLLNIPTLYHKEMKSVTFNISSINAKCLECKNVNKGVKYGVM